MHNEREQRDPSSRGRKLYPESPRGVLPRRVEQRQPRDASGGRKGDGRGH